MPVMTPKAIQACVSWSRSHLPGLWSGSVPWYLYHLRYQLAACQSFGPCMIRQEDAPESNEAALPDGEVDEEEEVHSHRNVDKQPADGVLVPHGVLEQRDPHRQHDEGRDEEQDLGDEELARNEERGPGGLQEVGQALRESKPSRSNTWGTIR